VSAGPWVDTATAVEVLGINENRVRRLARTGGVVARKVAGERGFGAADWSFEPASLAKVAARMAARDRRLKAAADLAARRLPGGVLPLSELCDRYILGRKARQEIGPATVTSMREGLRLFCQAVPNRPGAVNRGHIEHWLEGMARLAPATVRHRLSMARTFLDWCVIEGHLKRNPATGIRSPKVPRGIPRALRHEQVTAVATATPDTRAALMVSLGVQEGLRCGEIAGLEVGDVDLIDGSLLVRKGKGGYERMLPLSEETAGCLRRYLDEHPARAGALIRSYLNPVMPLQPRYISSVINRVMSEAGVVETAHSLRHTMATDCLRGGAHLRDVQALLGHASIGTTQRYLPTVVNDLRTAMGGRRYRSP
jgi:site-specific recombinase XerD